MNKKAHPKASKALSKDKLQVYMRATSHAISREVIAALLLLRWIDYSETEREAIAIFEDAPFNSILPSNLRWHALCRIDFAEADQLAVRISALGQHLKGQSGDGEPKPAVWLRRLSLIYERLSAVNSIYLLHELQRIAELPFETVSDRLKALEFFDTELDERSDSYHAQYSTPVNIAKLVVALADPQPGERIYDPCFGSANLLIEANRHLNGKQKSPQRSNPQLDVTGMEINEGSYLVGLVRMLLGGVEAPCVELGNSLECESISRPGSKAFDLVIANPPIGARVPRDAAGYKHFDFMTGDSTGLFIQHALSKLKRDGRAVIVVPAGFLFRRGAEQKLRRYLLEKGLVEAVIGLPAGAIYPHSIIKGSLLLLRKRGGTNRVRMVDAAPIFEQQSGRPVIRDGVAQQLVEKVLRLELGKVSEFADGGLGGALGKVELAEAVWEVGIDELKGADWDLSPVRREKGGLRELLVGLKEVLGDTGSVAPLSSVAEVAPGRPIKLVDLQDTRPLESAVGYVRVKDLTQGTVGKVSSWLRPDVTNREERWTLLFGDVLVSRSGTIGKAAILRDANVRAIAANGLYVVRTNPEKLDAGFFLAYLASPLCQNWLGAHSRGEVIQHLNRTVLDELPIPLPPLPVQVMAAAQFQVNGTDALSFLTQANSSRDSDRINSLLADLEGRVPKFVAGIDDTPQLARIEPIVELIHNACDWKGHEQTGSGVARWLLPLNQAMLPLLGVSQIPPGPGLLTVLRDAERGLQAAIEQIAGHSSITSQARVVCERLREWLRATAADLINASGLKVHSSPESLVAGSFSEFSVELVNPGSLPLRSVVARTQPEWGSVEIPYLAERGTFKLLLRGDIPKRSADVSLQLKWMARTLSGDPIHGEIELVIRVIVPESLGSAPVAELGGSPYVVGSPLEPGIGDNVFFGRKELLARIARHIQTHGNVVLLEGNRRAGKTSILKHLAGTSAIPNWLAVHSSLQGAEGGGLPGVPTAEVFRGIAASIAVAMIRLNFDVPLPNGQKYEAGKSAPRVRTACLEGIGTESPFNDFREYLEIILGVLEPLGFGLVLMLDEFDKLQEGIDNKVTSPQVPENIRFLIQTYPKFSAILTGSRRLKRLREEYWSALFGLGSRVQVTALDVDSARKVVTEPVRGLLTFSAEAIDRVVEITARQPFLMQCLCNCVFDFAVDTKSRSITASVIDEIAYSFVQNNEHFASLWRYAAEGPTSGRCRRQLILMLCALSFKQGTLIRFGTLREHLFQMGIEVKDELLDIDLIHLRDLELIEIAGDIGASEYRLAVPLMAEWIQREHDIDILYSRARTEAEDENV